MGAANVGAAAVRDGGKKFEGLSGGSEQHLWRSPEWWLRVLWVLLPIGLALLLERNARSQGDAYGRRWLGVLRPCDSIGARDRDSAAASGRRVTPTPTIAPVAEDCGPLVLDSIGPGDSLGNGHLSEKRRLGEQYGEVQRRIRTHGELLAFFNARYYSAVMMTLGCGVLAALCLTLLSRKGWDSAGFWVTAAFLVMTALTAFYASFPTVFKQEQNAVDNANLFVKYVNLDQTIRTYVATGKDQIDSSRSLDAFIHTVDRQMAELNRINIGFDPTKLPTGHDAFSTR